MTTKHTKTQKILAGILLGVNWIQGFAPIAYGETVNSVKKNKGQVDNFTAAYCQILQFTDNVVFGIAEGADVEKNQVEEKVAYSGATAVQNVKDGGTALACNFTDAAVQNVSGGGYAEDTTLNGGKQNVDDGGTTSNTVINNGGEQNVLSGGSSLKNIINSGGKQTINFRGYVLDTTIKQGGVQHVLSGGTAINNIVEKDGTQTVEVGGTVEGGTVLNGGQTTVGNEGKAVEVHVALGGTQVVNSGGRTLQTKISNGGYQLVEFGGSSDATQISMGGIQKVEGVDEHATILAGGEQNIEQGAKADYTSVFGLQNVNNGGSVQNAIIYVGGSQVIKSGGVATTVNISGGEQTVQNQGRTSHTSVIGGKEIVESGGIANETTLRGGTLLVKDGGTALTTMIYGGNAFFAKGMTASDTKILGGKLTFDEGVTLRDRTRLDTGVISLGADLIKDTAGKQYTISDLWVSQKGGTIILGTGNRTSGYSPIGRTLTIDKITGSANFVVNTDIANNQSDLVVIKQAIDSMTNTLEINFDPSIDFGKAPVGSVKVMQAPASVGLTGKEREIGAYAYKPNLTYENGYWRLNNLDILAPSKKSAQLGAIGALTLAQWREEDGTIARRLYNLKQNTQALGLWAQLDKADLALNQAYVKGNAYTIGYDIQGANSWTYGLAFSYGKGNTGDEYSTGDYKNYSVGVYGAWVGTDNQFMDIIARAGNLQHSFDTSGDVNPYGSVEDYEQEALSLTAKYGHHYSLTSDSYLEPYGKLGFAQIGGADYSATSGITVKQARGKSFYGQLGVSYGKHLNNKGLLYVDLAVNHELSGRADAYMSSNGLSPILVKNSAKGTWVDFNIGYQYNLGDKVSLNANIGKMGLGGDVKSHWKYSIGFTCKF